MSKTKLYRCKKHKHDPNEPSSLNGTVGYIFCNQMQTHILGAVFGLAEVAAKWFSIQVFEFPDWDFKIQVPKEFSIKCTKENFPRWGSFLIKTHLSLKPHI